MRHMQSNNLLVAFKHSTNRVSGHAWELGVIRFDTFTRTNLGKILNTQLSKPCYAIMEISIKKVSSQESNTEEVYRSGGLTPIPILLKVVFALSLFKSQYSNRV